MRLPLARLAATALLLTALTGPSLSTRTRAAIPAELASHVAARGTASVIVGVSVDAVPEGSLASPAAVVAQRAAISHAVDSAMADAADTGIPLGERFETVPYFTARVDAAGLQVLASIPGVVSIRENEAFSAQLLETVPLIGAPAAWSAGSTGAGWTVAVIDTGIDKSHPFLAGKVTSEACYSGGGGSLPPGFSSVCPGAVFQSTAVDSGVPCTPDAFCAHGTAVAGIAAGANGVAGISGVAPGANLISIQVTTRLENCVPGGISCLIFFESDLIRALERVLVLAGPGNVNRIAAVSTSVGSGRFLSQAGCDTWFAPIKAAIDNLRSIHIPVIVSAGNNTYTDGLNAPACISSAVSAGATTKTDALTWYSNRAPFLSLMAPGGDGLTNAGAVITSLPGGAYGLANGTSISGPHIAGAWAILKQAVPGASVAQVLAALRGGVPIPDPGTGRSYPRIDVNAARLALSGVNGAPGAPGRPAVLGSGNFVSLSWPAPVSGGAPQGYIIRARLAAGGPVVASLPLGEILSADLTAPNGTYVVSIQAANAAGLGPESAPLTLNVPLTPPPPGPPTGLAALVAGSSVHLFWTPPASGGEPVGYLLLAALSPGGPPIAGLTIPAPSWWTTIPGVPAGTYYLRLAAFNLGGASTLSNEVAVTVTPPQLPGPPVLSQPTITGNTVNLAWTRGPGETPVSYIVRASVSRGGPVVASLQVAATALSVPGVPRGTYFIVVHGVTAAGVGPPSNQVEAVVP
jgi:hypothetical protein